MYLEYYSLDRPPFRITPDPSLFFTGGANGRGVVLEALLYAVQSGEGILKVVGEVGSGKTMLCRMLEQNLPDTVDVVYLANPNLSPHDILYAIAFELKLAVDNDTPRLVLMYHLQKYLLNQHALNRTVLVMIEEAQSMPIETLEEIRLFSNLETHQHKLMQIVLFGQPELNRNLEQKNIRQLKERITHSFDLHPLTASETSDYIRFRLHAAGCPCPQVFTTGAEKLIARASGGLTRRINILADKAMLAAYADSATSTRQRTLDNRMQPSVTVRHVRAAIRDSNYGTWAIDMPRALAASVAAGVLLLGGLWWWLGDAALFAGAGLAANDAAAGEQQSAGAGSQAALVQAASPARNQNLDVLGSPSMPLAAPERIAVASLEESIRAAVQRPANAFVVPPVVAAAAPAESGIAATPVAASVTPTSLSPVPLDRAPATALAVEESAPPAVDTAGLAALATDGEAPSGMKREAVSEAPSGLARDAFSEPAPEAAAVAEASDTRASLPNLALATMPAAVTPAPAAQPAPPLAPPVPAPAWANSAANTADAGADARASVAPANPGESASLVAERARAFLEWIITEPRVYSIQVASTRGSDIEYMETMLGELQTGGFIDNTYVCRVTGATDFTWKVLYGTFQTVAEARVFITTLPDRIKANDPYVQNIDRLNCDAP